MFYNKKKFSLITLLLLQCHFSVYGNPNLDKATPDVSLPVSTYLKTSIDLFSNSGRAKANITNLLCMAVPVCINGLIIKNRRQYSNNLPLVGVWLCFSGVTFIEGFFHIVENYKALIKIQKEKKLAELKTISVL
jgi:hypothetical protein